MAYKALYRTYRPNTFAEVAGQGHIVKTLQNAVEQNKIAHAYLFCGPRGTGKTSIAKIFAKAVNCIADTDKPCMECENCLAVTDGTHPDIIEIDAASNNGVEEVRSLIEKVKYAPIKGRYKVYIIDEVHMMSAGAFNALLKTIEEPPAHVIFILATTEPQKVIPTIISRCQRYDFTKVSDKDIQNKLRIILENEHITYEDEVIRIIAQLCDGGMRDALSILDQCIAYAQDNLKLEHINEIYGIVTVQEKVELLSLIYQKKPAGILERLQSFIEKGVDIKRLTMDFIDILKESIIFDYTNDIQLLHLLNKNEVNQVREGISTTNRLAMIDILIDTYDKYRNAASINAYFEICLLKMIHVDEQTIVHKTAVKQVESTSKPIVESFTDKTVVSRETIEIKEPIKSEKMSEVVVNDDKDEFMPNKSAEPLDDEFVLQMLVGASKPEKQLDLQNYQRINEYTMELEWAREANLLCNGKIMASGSTYLILTVDSQAEANEINEKDSNNEFLTFTNELLKKVKKIFAVTSEQQTRVTNDFRERMLQGNLPNALDIQVKTINKKNTRKEKTNEERVVELFGKENIKITEE